MNHILAGLAASVLMIVCGSATVHAQTTRADSITNFVETFLSGLVFSGSERPVIRLAELPSRMPAGVVIPDDVRVAGSVEFPSLSFTILETDRPAAAMAAIGQTLEQGGWVLTPDLLQSARDGADPVPLAYCRDRQSFGLTASEAENRISLFHMSDQNMSPCNVPDGVNQVESQSPIPPLAAPAGARSVGTTGGGSIDEWHSSISLRTNLSLDEVRDHYITQLREHGAEIGSAAATEEAVLVMIKLSDPEGERWSGTITFSRGTDTDRRYVQIFVVSAGKEHP